MEACRHIISGAGIEIATRTGVKGERSYELFSAGTLICIGDSDLRHLSQRCLDLEPSQPSTPTKWTSVIVDPSKVDLSDRASQHACTSVISKTVDTWPAGSWIFYTPNSADVSNKDSSTLSTESTSPGQIIKMTTKDLHQPEADCWVLGRQYAVAAELHLRTTALLQDVTRVDTQIGTQEIAHNDVVKGPYIINTHSLAPLSPPQAEGPTRRAVAHEKRNAKRRETAAKKRAQNASAVGAVPSSEALAEDYDQQPTLIEEDVDDATTALMLWKSARSD
ncbi:hypothetical protein BDV98DRAFT_580996 [Pterulicium gracile]|uniref:Uncharacterized protein n=1 Tax=Pterulicium gracile TaxID=1884261 RepID=A0A5C3QTR3_9AGAR|nr:hypothetical protein BDV98DRAFT_580996 [Pterula gracilis]